MACCITLLSPLAHAAHQQLLEMPPPCSAPQMLCSLCLHQYAEIFSIAIAVAIDEVLPIISI